MACFKDKVVSYGQSRRLWVSGLVKALTLSGLVVAGGIYLRVARQQEAGDGFVFLSENAAHLLRLLIRDTQTSSRSKVDEGMLLSDIDTHLNQLEAHMQQEIRQLFTLLDFHPVRVMSGIRAQSVDSTEHPSMFLDQLRESRLGSFRIAYRFLVSVIQLHLYKYSEAWPDAFQGVPEQVVALRADYA